MVLSKLVTAFITLLLSDGVWIFLLLLLTSCILLSSRIWTTAKTATIFLRFPIACKLIAFPCNNFNMIYRFLFYCFHSISERICFNRVTLKQCRVNMIYGSNGIFQKFELSLSCSTFSRKLKISERQDQNDRIKIAGKWSI